METCFVFAPFYYIGVLGHNRLPLGGTFPLRDTLEWLRGLEKVTRASIDIQVSSK